jgi:hypothetical protein
MDLDVVSFPALIVAEDGWINHIVSKDDLRNWTGHAIKKYNKRRVVLFDNCDCAWQVESIVPLEERNLIVRLAHALYNPKLAVHIQVRPITGAPMETVREILDVAIDADDDILTQAVDAADLKRATESHFIQRSCRCNEESPCNLSDEPWTLAAGKTVTVRSTRP